MPIGRRRIRFDFRIDGVRYRPSLPWIPHEANMCRAREYFKRIQARIEAGTFRFREEFPDYTRAPVVVGPLAAQTCGDIFVSRVRSAAIWRR